MDVPSDFKELLECFNANGVERRVPLERTANMDYDTKMKKVVRIRQRDCRAEILEDLQFWLSLPPEVRVAEVFRLRSFLSGCSERLQRVARVLQRERG